MSSTKINKFPLSDAEIIEQVDLLIAETRIKMETDPVNVRMYRCSLCCYEYYRQCKLNRLVKNG